jgi:hypothetical protein
LDLRFKIQDSKFRTGADSDWIRRIFSEPELVPTGYAVSFQNRSRFRTDPSDVSGLFLLIDLPESKIVNFCTALIPQPAFFQAEMFSPALLF